MKRLATLIVLLLAASVRADITSNLDLFWRFDDNTGTSATDSSGNSRTGTLNNSPSWAAAKLGISSLSFNGSNSNVSRASYSVPSTGTAAVWVYPLRAYNAGVDENVFDFTTGTPVFQLRHYSATQIYAGFYQGTDYRVVVTASSSNWAQNTWQHFCLTWTSGGNTTLYRNGAQLGTPVGSTNSTVTANTLRAGSNAAGTAAGFSGQIDEFRIYSRALSAADVAELFSLGRTTRARMTGGASQKQTKVSIVH